MTEVFISGALLIVIVLEFDTRYRLMETNKRLIETREWCIKLAKQGGRNAD